MTHLPADRKKVITWKKEHLNHTEDFLSQKAMKKVQTAV